MDGVPDLVNVTTTQDRVEPGEAVKITADVSDKAYVEVNDSHVVASVTSPSGKKTEVPMEWTVSRDGEYRASFVPDEAGVYDIKVDATRATGDQKSLGASEVHVRASAGDAEYFDAAMRGSLLRRIAEDTGGRFFTPSNAALAAGSRHLHRPRRDRRRRARPLGHADPPDPPARAARRRVGLSPRQRACVIATGLATRGSALEGSGRARGWCRARR